MSDDITFCPKEECERKECMRHLSNCKRPEFPHSVSFIVPNDCPIRQERIKERKENGKSKDLQNKDRWQDD